MPDLYIIAGCNGAGKTTASYTILPEMLNVTEFVNADNIAAELSPGNPSKAALEAARIMLLKITQLISEEKNFAFETTLATRSYVALIKKTKDKGYKITLVYFWLDSKEIARLRVKERVAKGGHNIPEEVIDRRYDRGISNFFSLYKNICDYWILVDNSQENLKMVIDGEKENIREIKNSDIWNRIQKQVQQIGTKKLHTKR